MLNWLGVKHSQLRSKVRMWLYVEISRVERALLVYVCHNKKQTIKVIQLRAKGKIEMR